MTFNKILEQFKMEDPKVILVALEEMKQASENAWAEALKAEKNYYANVKEKERKITARIEELNQQKDYCQTQIDSLKKPLVAATVAGNGKELDNIKANMKEYEINKIQISTEIEMIETTHINGDEELYNVFMEKDAMYKKLRNDYRSAKRKAYELAGEMVEEYEAIKKDTTLYNIGGGYETKVDEINKHFYFEKYAEFNEYSNNQKHGKE